MASWNTGRTLEGVMAPRPGAWATSVSVLWAGILFRSWLVTLQLVQVRKE